MSVLSINIFSAQPLLGVSMTAEPIIGPITNSVFVAAVVTVLIVWFVRSAMKRRALIPDRKQNFVEYLVEFLYGQVEGIVGKKVAPRAFPLLATIFIYVLASNYFGLLPGVGTIGLEPAHAEHVEHASELHQLDAGEHALPEAAAHTEAHAEHHLRPILRPATADLNMTLGMALVFMVVWTGLTIRELGVWGFIVHTFGPKGGLTGFIRFFLLPIFIFVGLIEVVSILFRPVSLSLRLFGNIFAGESLLHTMATLGEKFGAPYWLAFVMKVVVPLPFYFLELLVGVLQATVFALLCAVYIQLSTTHEEGHGDHDEHDHDHDTAPAPAH